MDANFWHQRWSDNKIGFHEGEANELFVSHFKRLSLLKANRVFVPLCGKTKDIEWLLNQGFRVVGVELSELAIDQLFIELGIAPIIHDSGSFKHFSAKNIDIFVGDFFALSKEILGEVDAVFDRAALVALPEEMRKNYTKLLTQITQKAPQLLITFVYEQSLMDGPPFSIQNNEVKRHYAENYDIEMLQSLVLEGGFKHVTDVKESIWLLK